MQSKCLHSGLPSRWPSQCSNSSREVWYLFINPGVMEGCWREHDTNIGSIEGVGELVAHPIGLTAILRSCGRSKEKRPIIFIFKGKVLFRISNSNVKQILGNRRCSQVLRSQRWGSELRDKWRLEIVDKNAFLVLLYVLISELGGNQPTYTHQSKEKIHLKSGVIMISPFIH